MSPRPPQSTPSLASTLLEDDSPIATVDDGAHRPEMRTRRCTAARMSCAGDRFVQDRRTSTTARRIDPSADRTRDRCREAESRRRSHRRGPGGDRIVGRWQERLTRWRCRVQRPPLRSIETINVHLQMSEGEVDEGANPGVLGCVVTGEASTDPVAGLAVEGQERGVTISGRQRHSIAADDQQNTRQAEAAKGRVNGSESHSHWRVCSLQRIPAGMTDRSR